MYVLKAFAITALLLRKFVLIDITMSNESHHTLVDFILCVCVCVAGGGGQGMKVRVNICF